MAPKLAIDEQPSLAANVAYFAPQSIWSGLDLARTDAIFTATRSLQILHCQWRC